MKCYIHNTLCTKMITIQVAHLQMVPAALQSNFNVESESSQLAVFIVLYIAMFVGSLCNGSCTITSF